MSERLEKLKGIDQLSAVDGFCESLIRAEEEFGTEIKNNFKFSQKEYNVYGVRLFWLGKIDEWYYVGSEGDTGNEFKFFRNKKMIQMYLTSEFEGLEKEEKGFWMREIEIFN